MKIIKEAIEKNELSSFLCGNLNYKLQGREDNSEPTDFLYCWESEIIPYSKENLSLGSDLDNAMMELLENNESFIIGIYTVVNTIFWYYYFKKKGSISFELELIKLRDKLISVLSENKGKLQSTKLWAGVDWNSKDGLWEPIQRIALSIKDNYDGINFCFTR